MSEQTFQNSDKPHLVGYARVSMSDQTNRRQIDELIKYGVNELDIFKDVASGKNMKRSGWEACWRDLRNGDVLVIVSIDRLGRDLIEIVQVVRDLHEKGADLKVLSMDLDTRTPTGQLIFGILASLAQWERELIVERTNSGLAAAKARGNVGGRKKTITNEQVQDAITRSQNGENISKIAKEYGISRQGLYQRINGYLKDKAD